MIEPGEWVYYLDRLDCDMGRGMFIYYNRPYPQDLLDVEWLQDDFIHVFDETGAVFSASVRMMDAEDVALIFSVN